MHLRLGIILSVVSVVLCVFREFLSPSPRLENFSSRCFRLGESGLATYGKRKRERERERGHHCGITRTTEWKSVENWLGIPCWPGESFGRGREFYPPVLFDPRASACSFCDAKLKVSCLPRSWNEFDAFSDKLARLISRASLPRDYFDSMCSFFLSRLFCVRRRSFFEFCNSQILTSWPNFGNFYIIHKVTICRINFYIQHRRNNCYVRSYTLSIPFVCLKFSRRDILYQIASFLFY